MYIERDTKKSWSLHNYLLIAPTAAERKVLASEKQTDRIGGCLIISALLWIPAVGLLLGPHLDHDNGWHLALFAIAMAVPAFVLGWWGFRLNDRVYRMIDGMEKEDRAFEVHWRYHDIGIGNTLMKQVLFAGERSISTAHMRQVVLALDPSLLDQFIMAPGHVEILRGMSKATSNEEREAWCKLLDAPSLDALFVATQSEIDRLRPLEAERREIAEIDSQAEVRKGLLRVRQFAEKTGV